MMTAVFVPVAFMTGPVGLFYRQFSITMATSIVLSGVVALTLTPVLCAMILKNDARQAKQRDRLRSARSTAAFAVEERYAGATSRARRPPIVTGLCSSASARHRCFGVNRSSAGFVPNEDQGMFYAIIQTPPGATLERTNEVVDAIQAIGKEIAGVESIVDARRLRILTEGTRVERGHLPHQPQAWSERKRSVDADHRGARGEGAGTSARIVEFFEPPAVPGYGAASGFALRLLDKNNGDYHEFDDQRRVHGRPAGAQGARRAFTFFAPNYPQYEVHVDVDKAAQKGVSIENAHGHLDILIGSTYERASFASELLQGHSAGGARVPAAPVGRPEAHVRTKGRDGPATRRS